MLRGEERSPRLAMQGLDNSGGENFETSPLMFINGTAEGFSPMFAQDIVRIQGPHIVVLEKELPGKIRRQSMPREFSRLASSLA